MVKLLSIRLDDVGHDDWQSCAFLSAFAALRMPVSCAVVPAWLTPGMADFLLSLQERAGECIEIVQHGCSHENHAPEGERRYEFGPGRSFAQQRQDIEQGRELLVRSLKQDIKVFAPPHDRLSSETLRALGDMGFDLCLGSSRTFEGLRVPEPMRTLAYDVDASTRRDGRRTSRMSDDLFAELCASDASVAGLAIHAAEYRTGGDMLSLLGMLEALRGRGVAFETARGVVRGNEQA